MDKAKEVVVGQFRALRPSFLSKTPHFNFISAHYFYILSLAIIGSILVYAPGRGNIAYIDALFLTGCASTQAGLNTVDLNLLNTFQQVILYLWPMLSNPITINSFVVFLRLYWFEKRFQHIAREARLKRGTLSKSKARQRMDNVDVEKGVNGRKITVMLNGARSRITNDGMLLDANQPSPDAQQPQQQPQQQPLKATSTLPNRASRDDPRGSPEPRRPEIKFARTVTKSDGLGEEAVKLPPARPDHEHIAFLERQRKGDDEVLRIPNPRDAERGIRPKRVEAGDAREAGDDEETEAVPPAAGASETNGHPVPQTFSENRQQAITIEEPDRNKLQQSDSEDLIDDARAAAHAFSFLKLKKPRWISQGDKTQPNTEDEPGPGAASRTKTAGRRPSFSTLRTAFSSRDQADATPYLSWEPTIGRNSAFPDLTEEQREELGGIEYRSLKTLALILTGYFWIYSAIGVIGLLPWILQMDQYGQVVDEAGMSRTWWAFFTSSSAFMDLGFTLTPDSMISFSTATWPLLLLGFLIVIGNTGFPVMLRFIIWVLSLITPAGTGLYEELRFLLDHPRRCFTLLFPSGATWWLFWLLVIMNGLDVLFFIVLDLGSGPVVDLPAGLKVLNGVFEAISTRTAGFSCVNLAALHPAVQFSYMVMMYISVFPIAISVRRTNVYEEKSLGVYSSHDIDESANQNDLAYVGSHLRRQLSFDLWYIVLGFFIVNIAEGSKIMANEFSAFSVLFEVVSAYGTVGMSLGVPTANASLSSQFTVVGKLVIIAMVIRGRHRGLPYGLDRAILLPSESLNAREAADADARMARIQSHASFATGGAGSSINGGVGRRRSMDRGNILTSLLHPGPAIPVEPTLPVLEMQRTKSPEVIPGAYGGGGGVEEPEPYATRVSSRRTEPGGGGVVRRFESGLNIQQQQRPRTSGDGGD
ncbi:cation transport protein-domain-containing protein [Dichotomopilus funicola]|uniref:Potassium transport protein n=1 Tax=Dichotomopilus funicola TaxID=1934379 RepID=A0AAN6V037_9PEZI|nr:cation transport protein-domain-containing protein [Dichotomopilus funicola]